VLKSVFPHHNFSAPFFPPLFLFIFFLTFEVEASVSNEVLQMDIRQSCVWGVFFLPCVSPKCDFMLDKLQQQQVSWVRPENSSEKVASDPEKVTLTPRIGSSSIGPPLSLRAQ